MSYHSNTERFCLSSWPTLPDIDRLLAHRHKGYLDTCPKNDVISFCRKGFCALGLGIGLGLRLRLELAEIRLNMLSVKRPFGQVY